MASGFHWFVAWRYLMARPRWGSPALVAVATLACVIGAAFAALSTDALERHAQIGYHALWVYRCAIKGALFLFSLAAVALVVGAVGHTARNRARVGVPCAFTFGWMAIAGGLVARSSMDPVTHSIATYILLGGGVLVFITLLICFRAAYRYKSGGRVGRVGPFVVAGLLLAAGGAALAIAEYTLEPTADLALLYAPNWVRLPALGGLLLGLSGTAYVAVGYIVGRRPGKLIIGLTAVLLAASAAYPIVAVIKYQPVDLDSFNLVEPVLAKYGKWASYGLLGLGGGLALLAGFMTVASSQSRPHVLWQFGAAAVCAGGVAMGFVHFIWSPSDLPIFVPPRDQLDQQLLLVGVAALALAELTVVLGVTRYLFTFFTTVSIAGVAIGSMALVIVLSVMSGFENDLRQKILGHKAHMLVTKRDGAFTEYAEVAKRIEALKGVIATSPYLESELVIAANKNYSTAVIKGVDPRTVGRVTELDEHVQDAQAFERLWPLADDGGILGPPSDAGVPDVIDPGNSDGGVIDPDTVDPPPPDFLGGGLDDPEALSDERHDLELWQEGGANDGLAPVRFWKAPPEGATPPSIEPDGGDDGAAADASEPMLDPPPDDLIVGIDEPEDYAGDGDDDDDDDDDDGKGRDIELIDIEPWDDSFKGSMSAEELSMRPWRVQEEWLASPPRIPPEVARLPGVLVGRELKKQIHLHTGQEVRIISPLYEDTPAGPVPRTRSLRVADVFYTGMYEYDFMNIYVALDVLQAFLDREGEVTGIEIRIKDPDNTAPVLNAMRKILPDSTYRVQDWQEINRSLFSALKLEKIAMFLVLAIIILVASFSIIGNLIMVVIEKAREIALIKTLGASNFGVMKIFISQGFFIGVVGTAIGVAHGLVASGLGSTFGLPLNPEVYYIDRLPIHVEQGAVLAVAVAGMLISVVATIYPAYVGARLQPIEGLRYE